MIVAVTGARGFIGQNLMVHLAERGHEAIPIGSDTPHADLHDAVARADFVFHIAGVNRANDASEFENGNVGAARTLCRIHSETGSKAPIVYASSLQAERDTPYGRSKLAAETVLLDHARARNATVRVFRLVNVFGKWARPNYNSVIATFCHNIARGLPITIHDPAIELRLVHVDDVCSAFLALLDRELSGSAFGQIEPEYTATVGSLAEAIKSFAASRTHLHVGRVGEGLTRALYSTYVSYLDPDAFTYEVPRHFDERGVFVEMLKTPDSGQVSYFTVAPGVTRGEHYHHTKTEKFLVLAGRARFRFRHIVTNERHEIIAEGGAARIVETIPGWAHDITNIGDADMVVMLWANEVFDRARPDTVAQKV